MGQAREEGTEDHMVTLAFGRSSGQEGLDGCLPRPRDDPAHPEGRAGVHKGFDMFDLEPDHICAESEGLP
jgi:hypothetical protein